LNRGFISNGASGTITIFNLPTLTPIQTIKVGDNPDAICYEPVTRRVFAFNGRSQTASVLDAATGKVVGEISLPGKPEFAQADGGGFIFDNIEDKGLVLRIDAAKMAIIEQWALPAESKPSALAIDIVNHRLFAGCDGRKLYVLDSQSGKVIATLPIGDGIDAAVYDPANKHIFASCGDGTLTIIKQESADQYSIEAKVKTEHGARTMAFDSSTQTAYLPSAEFGSPPASTADHPHPRPPIVPNSLKLLVLKP
jgi:DNA-binding beta-propeller fold protein YncE